MVSSVTNVWKQEKYVIKTYLNDMKKLVQNTWMRLEICAQKGLELGFKKRILAFKF